MNFIDNFLNNTTMYRLVLYVLIFLLGTALILSIFGILPFGFLSLLFSAIIILVICFTTNTVFANVFKVPANIESVYITALILALIISPLRSINDLPFLGWAGILAIASKYILAINRKHIFNPAAIAAFITAMVINQSASWWIGTSAMMPFILISGLLIVRKIKRKNLVLSFLFTALLTIFLFSFLNDADLFLTAKRIFLDTPILFFVFVMLTEPLTTPPNKTLQIIYGGIVGFLFAPQIHIGSFYSTPETALVLGNIFSYIVSPKIKLVLKLKEKIQLAPGIYDFIFNLDKKIAFKPGQYMEWTLGHNNPDNRGNRRYFTISSSPTENDLRIGIKFYDKGSTFKKSLLSINSQSEIIASQLSGNFVLNNKNEKYVFIAGGIGITPFRSMIKYLIDTNQKKDIILFYSNRNSDDIIYKDIFDVAESQLGIKTIYVLTDVNNAPLGWRGETGYINEEMIRKDVPDYKERRFYISGPHFMVFSFKEMLIKMGVRKEKIKTDYFPGFA